MAAGIKHNQKSVFIVGTIITGILFVILCCGCVAPEREPEDLTNSSLHNTTPVVNITPSASKPANITIKVVKFEPARPCSSCIKLGNYAKETIEIHFPEEYKSGKISYETVNYQDPKNIDLVKKYGISGSSLYITVIQDDEEEIIDANDMWRYIGNKEQYMNVFKAKVDEILKG